jgi:hypothetical protein
VNVSEIVGVRRWKMLSALFAVAHQQDAQLLRGIHD